MAKKDHSGNMSKRVNRLTRIPDLGYYLIVTDTKGTEGNYINGLKNTLPAEMQGRLVIKVSVKYSHGLHANKFNSILSA